jgi:hypothetical protein
VANDITVNFTDVSLGTPDAVTATDANSIRKYGYLKRTINAGDIYDAAMAAQFINAKLLEYAEPATESQDSGGNGETSLTIELAGYVRLFETYTFSSTGSPAYISRNQQIADVVDADPNGIFYSGALTIPDDATTFAPREQTEQTAASILNYLLDLGDSDNNFWLMTVGRKRRITIATRPASTEISYQKSSNDFRFKDMQDKYVDPWTVKPGRWMIYKDIIRPANYMGAVSFTIPNKVTFSRGQDLSPADIIAKRFGLERPKAGYVN